MNILFHIDVECVPENGGIERVTSLLTPELRERGHKVFSSYTDAVDREAPRPEFDGVFHLRRNDVDGVAEILKDNEIDVIVVQKVFRDLPWMREAITRSGRDVKMIYAMHTRPKGIEGMQGFRQLVFNDKKKHAWLKVPLKVMLHPLRARQYNYRQFSWPGIYADFTVVLSKRYVEPWISLSKTADEKKMTYIGNPLTFDVEASLEEIRGKRKKVLIVARISENEKNLTEALKIWKEVENTPDYGEWELDIVGDGPDRKAIESLANKMNLKRVVFHGYKSPKPYYEAASIYMMTSRFEGWPMTINEACQNGCVPLAYDSFLAIHDIIEDGENGYIIGNHDMRSYIQKMTGLMKDDALREKMALNGVRSSKRFTVREISDRWEELFKNLADGRVED